jgi:hypothetical protein
LAGSPKFYHSGLASLSFILCVVNIFSLTWFPELSYKYTGFLGNYEIVSHFYFLYLRESFKHIFQSAITLWGSFTWSLIVDPGNLSGKKARSGGHVWEQHWRASLVPSWDVWQGGRDR